MSSSSQPAWRPTSEEVGKLWSGVFGLLPAALGAPYLSPFASLVAEYAFRRRDQLFTLSRDGAVAPRQAWNAWDRPVRRSGRDRALEYDLLSLLGRYFLSEQRIIVTPGLTREARAVGLRAGDPVPVAFVNRSFMQSESGLIVPAQVGRPVTVALPRGDYQVFALGSPGESIFRAHDPYVAGGTVRLAPERRSSVELPLLPRGGQRAKRSRARVTPRGRERSGVRCIYCGWQSRGESFLEHVLTCSERPDFGRRTTAAPAAVCMVCHRTFTDRSSLHAHMRNRHYDVAAEMLRRKRKDDADARAAIRSPLRRRPLPRISVGTRLDLQETKARPAPDTSDKRDASASVRTSAGSAGADPSTAKRVSRARVRKRPARARREFVDEIGKRGFWLSPGAKHVYYHDIHYLTSRIVLTATRIRFEIGNTKTGKYELWRSYGLVDEAKSALAAIAELKNKRPTR